MKKRASSLLSHAGAQRLSNAARFEASRPGLSASRWPVRYSTCFGAPSPDHSSRTAMVSEHDLPTSAT